MILLPEQIQDLKALTGLCHGLKADPVIIGASAFRIFFSDRERYTEDVDLAIALDLDDFMKLTEKMKAQGWVQDSRLEHRWRGPNRSQVDILPAGPTLRKNKNVNWPRSGMRMSLIGFDHVFNDAVIREIGPGLTANVIPPPVLVLLKIAAYLDDRTRRQKDLEDVYVLMKIYEAESERCFSEEVLAANLPDFEFVPAFLLA